MIIINKKNNTQGIFILYLECVCYLIEQYIFNLIHVKICVIPCLNQPPTRGDARVFVAKVVLPLDRV